MRSLYVSVLVVWVLLAVDASRNRRATKITKAPRPNKGKEICEQKGPPGCRSLCAKEEGAGGFCNIQGECICTGSYKPKPSSTSMPTLPTLPTSIGTEQPTTASEISTADTEIIDYDESSGTFEEYDYETVTDNGEDNVKIGQTST